MIRLHDPWPYSDDESEPRISVWEIIGVVLVFLSMVAVIVAAVVVWRSVG